MLTQQYKYNTYLLKQNNKNNITLYINHITHNTYHKVTITIHQYCSLLKQTDKM